MLSHAPVRTSLFESLEARQLLSTFTVLNNGDAGAGSLRQAIIDANALGGADVIEFDAALSGGTITLTTGELPITDDLTITGLGAELLAVNGNNSSRVFSNTATSFISGLTIENGNATNGSGIFNNNGTLTLTNSIVTGNTASYAAGLHNLDGTMTVGGSLISGNSAGEVAGIYNAGGTLTVTNSTVSANTATGGRGGGLYSHSGPTTLTNSTISGNTASTDGGGIFLSSGTLTLTNSTVANSLGGSGLYVSGGTATLTSTIMAGNTGGDIANGTLDPSSSNNLIQDAGSSGGLNDGENGNIVGEDPLLGVLADNGGPTQTHALLAGSPALDAGSNPDALNSDQRGVLFSRSFDGTPDIGAYEHQSISMMVNNATDVVDSDLANLSLREAIEQANANPLADEIGFDGSLSGTTITLGGTELSITDDLTITGLGAELLAVSGNNTSRVFINSATTTISGLTITDGNSGGDSGGGIRNQSGMLTLANSSVSGNFAAIRAGGIYNTSGTLTLTNSTVSGNTAGNWGGGIFVDSGTLTVTNSTITGNIANSLGGGIWHDGGMLSLTNSTVANNAGGGLYFYDSVTLTSTIMAGNTGGDVLNGTLEAGSSNNLIQDAGSSGGLSDGENGNIVGHDPLLSALASNGGPTMTLALLDGSPAIGAGSNPDSLTTDQRGGLFSRGSSVDIGAYQRQTLSVTVSTNLDESDDDFSPGDLSLREAIELTNANPLADEIGFDSSLNWSIITLLGTQLSITDDLTINGLGASRLTVRGNNSSRVFSNTATTSISGLTISNGNSGFNYGAGLMNSGTLTLTGTTVSGNTADDVAGIYNTGGTLTLMNSMVSGNTAPGWVGGIYNEVGTLILINSTVSGNTAGIGDGAGIYNQDTLNLTNSTVSGNTAQSLGGGIYNTSGTVTLTSSTVSGNTAGAGGGIYNIGGTLTLTNSTVANNLGGGGLYFQNGSTATLTSTIVAGNAGGDVLNGTLDPSSSNNLIQDAGNAGGLTDGENGNIVGQDPLLSDLDSHGGPTQTHALLEGSPAIGAGSNPASLTTDQRGGLFSRGSSVDIGAYQRQSFALVVDTLADGDDGDYSAGNLSLREALTVAVNPGNDIITFDPSLNGGTITLAGAELRILGELTINGPGADLLTVSGDDASRVLYIDADTGPVSISGLTITRGNTDNGFDGGGIYINGGVVMLSDLTVSDNMAELGGGIFSLGTLTITGSTISGNTAKSGSGGGIYNDFGISVTVTDSTIDGNTAQGDGGGIYHDGDTLTLTGSTVSQNTAGGDGGGIAHEGNSLTLTNSTVSGNAGDDGGGGIYIGWGGPLAVTNSTISGNAADEGGGIYNSRGMMTLTNSTISGNTSDNGGGIYNSRGMMTLTNSTVASNLGGGIWLRVDDSLTLTSTIVAGNTGGDVLSGTLDPSSSNNLIQDASTSGGLTDGENGNIVGHDPLLGDLADNGGPTRTHSLLAGSPAIGAGSNPDALTTDQRGTARTRGSAIDIGSFEANVRPTLDSLSSSHTIINRGQTLSLTAGGVDDPDGTITEVRFYLDANGDGIAQDSELLGTDTDGSDGFSFDYVVPANAAYASTAFLAVALDNDGETSTTADTSVTVQNLAPTLGGLAGSATEFAQGDALTLSAVGAADTDGSISEVRFYLDANGDGIAQDSELLGTDTDGSDGFSLTLTSEQTAALALGTNSFLAVAFDDGGDSSATRARSTSVLFSLHAGNGSIVSGSSTGDDTFWTGVVNRAGDVILFETATGTAVHLRLEAGAPKSTGDVTVFTDAKDGLVYAAYPSAEGLIIARRAADGTWAFRNLTAEAGLQSDRGPIRSLTQLTSTTATGRVLVIAGINGSGDIVAFQQSGSSTGDLWGWSFVDISADLSSQGMTTPVFTELISYVTPWNAWTLAGIDGDGNIQSVWVAPASFTTWRIDNLSTITGAPPISGQLTVTQTSWSAINLGGVDANGHLVVTWWVPSFGGDWVTSDLTGAASGETLNAGRATGFVTPWGAINYAGINAAGDVTVYWWTPQTGGWVVTPLTGNLTGDRPEGSLTSHVSAAGTMSVLGSTDEGEVTRLWWAPNDDGRWKLDNLSDGAIRA